MSTLLKSGRRRWLSIPVIASVLVLLMASSHRAQEMAKGRGLKVTIMVYAGRPDPTYTIEDQGTIDRLMGLIRLAKTNPKPGTPVIPPILGYKGVVVDNQGRLPGIPLYVAVYRGNMEVETGGKRFLIDEGRAVEKFLLQAAVEKKVIDEAALRSLESEK